MPSPPKILTALIIAALACGMGRAALAESHPAPVSAQDVGPWESVLWVHAGKVDHCTLSRARSAPSGVSYGWFVDHEVGILGVEALAWTFKPVTEVEVVVTPQHGAQRKMTARAVTPNRANLEFGKDRSLLDDLQRSEHVDIRIGEVTVRLAFDDFNAARVVLESCVQRIGARVPPHHH